MESKNIGIIGINGGYGKWLQRKLEALGHNVIGSDLDTILTNAEVAKASEVLFTTVPISASIAVLSEVAPLLEDDQLWIDMTGQKTKQMEIMETSKAYVIGLHPMCSPAFEDWEGQGVIVCDRVGLGSKRNWFGSFLHEMNGYPYLSLDPISHDQYVLAVQRITSLSLVGWMNAIVSLDLDPEILAQCTSPTFRLLMEAATRMGGQPKVYKEILATAPAASQELEGKLVEESIVRAMEFFAKMR